MQANHAESKEALATWARELGVDPSIMQRLVELRRAAVYDVASDPRSYGFDLLEGHAARRDVASEFSREARLTGALGRSFLQGHAPLLALVPDPLTLPDGSALDAELARTGHIDAESAAAVAMHIRATIQATLGAPLDEDSVSRAVQEAAWDFGFDVQRVTPLVLEVVTQAS